MELFSIKDLSFTYPDGTAALSNITLSVPQGAFITVCGMSGCGKTTLLRQLKPALTPHGERSGEIRYAGAPLQTLDARAQAAEIGYVLQSPDNQLVTDQVWHELAFGLENLGLPNAEIERRVSEMASFFGLSHLFHRKVSELSGGQKQMVCLASVMAMHPKILLLDEPTAQLDPVASTAFFDMLKKINIDLGTTILLSEHRLEEVLPLSDRVWVMDSGRIWLDAQPAAACAALAQARHPMFSAMPTPARVCMAVTPEEQQPPVTVRAGRSWLDAYLTGRQIPAAASKPQPHSQQAKVLSCRDVFFRYSKDADDILRGLQLRLFRGELYALIGSTGAGKTTLLSLLCGLQTPYRGKVRVHNQKICLLPQDPQTVFLHNTVRRDLSEAAASPARLAEVLALCDLEEVADKHPYDLSGGQQQRAALAKVLLQEPDILLLDEPTKGLDAHFKQKFASILDELRKHGLTVCMVSHDVEFCAAYADRCGLLFDGKVVSEGPAARFFAGNHFYTTAANRMARTHFPDAVTAEEIVRRLGGSLPAADPPENSLPVNPPPPVQPVSRQRAAKKRGLSRQTLLPLLCLLVLTPLTIAFGIVFLEDRKYYFISLMLLIYAMLSFFLHFEGRRPQARELVLIAVLCAVGVAGRAAFFMVPQVKPLLAIVLLSGICFGGETGFLVGAVSALLSNMIFGQGPWTPWQMFAQGLSGYLGGLIFQEKGLPRRTVPICIFGGFAALVIYGGIMNPASVLTAGIPLTTGAILTGYAAGLPFDALHALSTIVFLAILTKPVLGKLDRIKIKYGLFQ